MNNQNNPIKLHCQLHCKASVKASESALRDLVKEDRPMEEVLGKEQDDSTETTKDDTQDSSGSM
jgi:hypothetical protein